nr:hypothetical protein GCM10020092_008360 [Actinoplanes digitatis]
MRAMVIDDSRAMRMILKRIVAKLNFEAIEAGDGQEALDLLATMTEVPELALIDWNMPNMNGLEFVTKVRAEPRLREMTLVMVTTESEQSQIVRALAAGAHEYVIKPFTEGAMIEKAGPAGPSPDRSELMSRENLVGEDDLAEMVEQVWVSYLDPEGISPLVLNGDATQLSEVHSTVSITGTWHGHLVYASSRKAAEKAAAAFLAMEPEEVSQDDLSDVLGELANIVGGNVKAMLLGRVLPVPAHGGAGAGHGVVLPGGRADHRPLRRLGRRAGFDLDVAEREAGGERMKILIADDSRVMRQIVTRTLRQAGFGDHDLVEAADGQEAVDKTVAEKPDLVISDWNMPELTGIEVLRKLRASGNEVKFGFVTSESTPEMQQAAEAAGAAFFIVKPFTAERF